MTVRPFGITVNQSKASSLADDGAAVPLLTGAHEIAMNMVNATAVFNTRSSWPLSYAWSSHLRAANS